MKSRRITKFLISLMMALGIGAGINTNLHEGNVTRAATTTYTQITSLDELVDGLEVIISADSSGKHYYLPNDKITNTGPKATEFSLSDYKTNMIWTMNKKNSGFTFSHYNDSTKLDLYFINDNNGVRVNSDKEFEFSIIKSTTDNTFTISGTISSDTRNLALYSTQDFRCYKTSSGIQKIILYKVQDIQDESKFNVNYSVDSKVKFKNDFKTSYEFDVGTTQQITLPSKSDFENDGTFYAGTVGITGWNDGQQDYELGASVTVSENTTFTAKYEQIKKDLTVEEAINVAKEIGSSADTNYEYSCESTIFEIKDQYSLQYGNITLLLGDKTNNIEAYRLTGGEELEVGDIIKVTGYLFNYNNKTPEFSENCTYELIKKAKDVGPGEKFNELNSFARLNASYNKTISSSSSEKNDSFDAQDFYTSGTYHELSNETNVSKIFTFSAFCMTNLNNGEYSFQLSGSKGGEFVITSSLYSIKKISLSISNNNTNSGSFEVYGKDEKYETYSDLSNTSKQGTLIKEISSYNKGQKIDIDCGYKYFGIKATSGTVYITNISVTYEEEATTYEVTNAKLGFGVNFDETIYSQDAKFGLLLFDPNTIVDYSDLKSIIELSDDLNDDTFISLDEYKNELSDLDIKYISYENLTPIKVDENGNPSESGNQYQYGIFFNNALENIDSSFVAMAYMELNGELYLAKHTNEYSLRSLAQYYKDNNVMATIEDANGVLDAIINYGN